jgi:hypothetical protein
MYVIRRWEMHAERSDLYARARDAVPGDARYMAHGADSLYSPDRFFTGLRIVGAPPLSYIWIWLTACAAYINGRVPGHSGPTPQSSSERPVKALVYR